MPVSIKFYFESSGSGRPVRIFRRDDIIHRTARSAVPLKVPSLASRQENFFFKKRSYFGVDIMDKSATRYSVQLYIYDLSRGMARSLSPIMLGKYR